MNVNPKVVDIYHGDTVTSFAKAYDFGIRGVIHKATEGLSNKDERYAERDTAVAKINGMLWGAYHFMRPGDPVTQADHFVDVADPDPGTLMALDHEDPHVPLSDAVKFLRTVEARTSRKPVLYSGFLIKQQIDGASATDKAYLATCRLWLAQYVHVGMQPTWPKIWAAPWLWQYTGDGMGQGPNDIPGLQARMDVNSYAGSDAQLVKEWAGVNIQVAKVSAGVNTQVDA